MLSNKNKAFQTRKEGIAKLKSMLQCLQLIVTNDGVAYHYSRYLVLDEFMAVFVNAIKSTNFKESNYLENLEYPFELVDHKNKLLMQVVLSNREASLFEPFDSFQDLMKESPKFKSYTLVLIRLGIDSIENIHQFMNGLRKYDFSYRIYSVEDIMTFIESLRDYDEIVSFYNLVNHHAYLFKDLLNQEDDLMEHLIEKLSMRSNVITAKPTIVPQSDQDFYENTMRFKEHNYTQEQLDDVVLVLNAYSRHHLGARYCLSSVYSYLRGHWIMGDLGIQSTSESILEYLHECVRKDIGELEIEYDEEHLERMIDGIIIEALLRLKIAPDN